MLLQYVNVFEIPTLMDRVQRVKCRGADAAIGFKLNIPVGH